MNVHAQSLALAKAWLDSIDDDVFLQEYNTIAEYAYAGPTVDEFMICSLGSGYTAYTNSIYESNIEIEFSNYVELGALNKFSFGSVLFNYGNSSVSAPLVYDRVNVSDAACNDEDYSLAA